MSLRNDNEPGRITPDSESTVNQDEIDQYLADKEPATVYDDAIAAFLSGKIGVACCDIFTLESARSQDDFQKYLLARLHTAFEAGWDAHQNEVDTILRESYPSIKPQAE